MANTNSIPEETDASEADAVSGAKAAKNETPVAGEVDASATAGPLAAVTVSEGVDDALKLSPTAADPASTGAVQTIAHVIPQRPQAKPAARLAPVVAKEPSVDRNEDASEVPPSTAERPESFLDREASETPAPDSRESLTSGAPTFEAAAHQPASSPRRQREDGPEPAAALTSDRLLNKVAAPPVGGWRLWLFKASFGAVNVGDSDKVRLERAQDTLIASRLGDRTRFVPVLSRKGGVGKTTVTTLLGMALADIREDRVIAMDANPDRGTLSDRSPGSADFTARNLVKDRFNVTTFSQLSNYVARDGSRLDVLASDTDPAVAQAFDDSDYRAVTDVLSRFYSVVLTDSGTGMVHSVMKGTLEKADAVVLVSGGSVDEARLASETLSWLEAHGRHDLVSNAIVVVNMSGGETQVNINQIEEHFKSRVRNVLRIPYDKHLAEGSRVDLAKLRPATRQAVKELAALVVTELQRP